MVMGPTHALSGAATWLTLSAVGSAIVGAGAAAGTVESAEFLPVVALGTAVCAGAALAPDADSHSSTFVNSLGIFGKVIHEVTNTISLFVYNLTKTKYDPPKTNGHRTLTHTAPFAILMGVLVSALSVMPGTVSLIGKEFAVGQLFSLLFMSLFLHLALAGLFEKHVKKARKKYGPYVLMLTSAALTVATASFLPEGETYGWLGAAVAIGYIVHCLGDMITKMGVPLVMPIKIKGKRWYDVTLPAFMRIKAGGAFEYAVLLPLFSAITFLAAGYHIPGMRGIVDSVLGILPF